MESAQPNYGSAAAALHAALARIGASSPSGFRRDLEPGMTAYATGVPMARMNGIAVDRSLYRGDVSPSSSALQRLGERGVPWTLQIFGDGPAANVPLSGIALSQENVVPTYVLPLSDLPTIVRGSQLRIRRVETSDDRAGFARVLGHAFGAESSLGDPLVDPSILGDPQIGAFLGRVEGEPVVTGMAVGGGAWVGIFAIATAEKFRSRGFGETMTRRLIQEGQRQGGQVACLQASPLGLALYRRLGFVDAGDDTTYRTAVTPR